MDLDIGGMIRSTDTTVQAKELEFKSNQTAIIHHGPAIPLHPRQIKDKSGCLNCKRRKVKCPDTNRPCQRCQSRGETCERKNDEVAQWRITLPRLSRSLPEERGVQIAGADWSLLDYWFNRSCRLLCNEPQQSLNPFSSSLVLTLASSRAATHSIQSLSAAYKEAFRLPEMKRSFEERGLALRYLRRSISDNAVPTDAGLFSIVIIGLSTAWFCDSSTDVGTEHLSAAHTAVMSILNARAEEALQSDLFLLSAGLYIYWDMACSFATSQNLLPTRDARLMTISKILDQRRPPSPVLGISTELFLLLGSVGRYCRHALLTEKTNDRMEADLRKRLLNWQPTYITSGFAEVAKIAECYRSTGLIILDSFRSQSRRADDFESRLASTFSKVASISAASPLFGFQTLILAMIGTEITDSAGRSIITQRFFELYQYNRLRVNYEALGLVQETWTLRDSGRDTSAIQLMHKKGLSLMLG